MKRKYFLIIATEGHGTTRTYRENPCGAACPRSSVFFRCYNKAVG
ncbi:hypothetical protein [Hoylesella timonensis]|nr:hypothetical protein [Hoylesella timonensis]